MSYDLMVFRKEAAPKNEKDFMEWYSKQAEWTEDHGYDDPSNTSDQLKNWFMEMKETFPALNGPFASTDPNVENLTDYTIGKDVIYAAFASTQAGLAYKKMIELAEKYKLGFFDTWTGDILIPTESGKLESIKKSEKEKKAWWKF